MISDERVTELRKIRENIFVRKYFGIDEVKRALLNGRRIVPLVINKFSSTSFTNDVEYYIKIGDNPYCIFAKMSSGELAESKINIFEPMEFYDYEDYMNYIEVTNELNKVINESKKVKVKKVSVCVRI
jgi:hypothetical protein